jgi:hypothetical protein
LIQLPLAPVVEEAKECNRAIVQCTLYYDVYAGAFRIFISYRAWDGDEGALWSSTLTRPGFRGLD